MGLRRGAQASRQRHVADAMRERDESRYLENNERRALNQQENRVSKRIP
jgi:hypothetical protein